MFPQFEVSHHALPPPPSLPRLEDQTLAGSRAVDPDWPVDPGGKLWGDTDVVIVLQLGGDWHYWVSPARSTQVRLNPLPEPPESEWKTILTLVTRCFYYREQ